MKKTEYAKLLDMVYNRATYGWSRNEFALAPETVVKLIKAERARVRRVVRKMANESQSFDVQEFTANILTKLKEGR